ncbi:hypothetical protein DRJ27_05820, partial [Candidatus Acetothermia bacterium]
KNRGTASYVTPQEDLEGVLTSFYAKIAQPALTDLSLDVQGVTVYDLYPRELPDLFYGAQLTLVGRYAGSGPATVVLRGMRDSAEETYALEAEFPALSKGADFLPRLWASRKIGHLLKRIILEGESEELVKQIVELGTRYGIATPYTSFLVEEAVPPPPATVQLVPAPPLALRAVPLAKSAQQLAAAEAPRSRRGSRRWPGGCSCSWTGSGRRALIRKAPRPWTSGT